MLEHIMTDLKLQRPFCAFNKHNDKNQPCFRIPCDFVQQVIYMAWME